MRVHVRVCVCVCVCVYAFEIVGMVIFYATILHLMRFNNEVE